jgi:multidrug efflux pump subunit AcrA (membrane-fusion protein)
VVAVERKSVARTRLLGGEVVLPLGPARTQGTNAGARFAPSPPASTAEVLKLSEMQLQADGEIEKARIQLDIARIALERAEKLLRSETGSQRALDDARAALRLAETTSASAQSRRELLGEPVRRTSSLDHLWVRVPVYVGELASLDAAQEARMGNLGDRPGSPTRAARFVAGPPSANPGAASVDWFYEFEDKDHSMWLGQRVGVTLRLRAEEESLVVPWAAVLHDVHGGEWLYENTAPQTFVRRRVQVSRVEGDLAILASGVKPGAKVVTDGAAELFGTEFGPGH